jgi:hypothetical protein
MFFLLSTKAFAGAVYKEVFPTDFFNNCFFGISKKFLVDIIIVFFICFELFV